MHKSGPKLFDANGGAHKYIMQQFIVCSQKSWQKIIAGDTGAACWKNVSMVQKINVVKYLWEQKISRDNNQMFNKKKNGAEVIPVYG